MKLVYSTLRQLRVFCSSASTFIRSDLWVMPPGVAPDLHWNCINLLYTGATPVQMEYSGCGDPGKPVTCSVTCVSIAYSLPATRCLLSRFIVNLHYK
jgi:hypothetical protein